MIIDRHNQSGITSSKLYTHDVAAHDGLRPVDLRNALSHLHDEVLAAISRQSVQELLMPMELPPDSDTFEAPEMALHA